MPKRVYLQYDPADFVPSLIEDSVEVSLEAQFFAWLERGHNAWMLVAGAGITSGCIGAALVLAGGDR